MPPILQQLAQRLFRLHPGWYVLFAALLLTSIGYLSIDTVRPPEASKQATRLLPVALLAMAMCFIPSPRTIGYAAYALYALTLGLLIFLFLPGVPTSIVRTINGARSWIQTPLMNIQPSEITKISYVLATAWFLRYRDSFRRIIGWFVPFLLMAVPLALILKQPDLGTALIFPPALFAMLIAAGARMRHLIAVALMVLIGIVFVVSVIVIDPPHERSVGNEKLPSAAHILAGHQERRIAALIWPDEYKQRDAFQQLAAKNVIGSAGWTGHGKQQSAVLIRAAALPEPHNDMIYAVIVGRWGVFGGLAIIGLYAVLVISMLLTAARTKDPFARLACVGFAGMMLAQSAINIAMNVGMMPITGITLPFVSYGGSSLLTCFMMVGLVLNFATRKNKLLQTPTFEWDEQA